MFRYTGCGKNTFHILYCHLCGENELKQVAMVANVWPSPHPQLWSWLEPVHTQHLPLKCFQGWWICNCYTETFLCSFHVTLEWFSSGYKITTALGWKFYPEHHHSDLIWNEQEKLCVATIDSQKRFNSKCIMCTGPTHEHESGKKRRY